MDKFYDWIRITLENDNRLYTNLIITAIVIITTWIIDRLIFHILLKRIQEIQNRYKAKKVITYITIVFAIIIIGSIWIRESYSLTTFVGLMSAGIAIALKDLVVNVAAWMFIMWRRPFEVGDRIQIGTNMGDVIDIRIFQFTILEIGNWVDGEQSTGRIIHIPNGKVFSENLANYNKAFHYIWNEIPVLLTFESDWKSAKQILLKIAQRHSEHLSKEAERKVKEASWKFMIFYTKLTPIVYTSVRESGIMLTIRYLCEPRKRRTTVQAIWEDILDEFEKNKNMSFAYPTQRIIHNDENNKQMNKNIGGHNEEI